MNSVTFVRNGNGLGRKLPDGDHVSGMIFYTDTTIGDFATKPIQVVKSIYDAEQIGITDTSKGETKATGGNVLVTTAGAVGDVNTIFLNGIELGSYTVITSDDATDVAVSLRASINSNTKYHGVTAAGSTANVSLTLPDGFGVTVNGTNISFTTTGTGAVTLTQFSGGVGSDVDVMHYHISEYFRLNTSSKLYIMIDSKATYTGEEIETIQQFSGGILRRVGVYLNDETFATSLITDSQTFLNSERESKRPLQCVIQADFVGLTLSDLSDLGTLTANDVVVLVAEDKRFLKTAYSKSVTYQAGEQVTCLGKVYKAKKLTIGESVFNSKVWGEVSKDLRAITGKTVGTLGSCLGTMSKALPHESIAWVDKFNLVSDDLGLDEVGFADGSTDLEVSKTIKEQLDEYHYTFLTKFQGLSGTYWSNSYTAISITNDLATIENNAVLDKAERLVYSAIIGLLSSPLYVNKDGTLTDTTVQEFTQRANNSILPMQDSISGLSVGIDPTQDVLTTSEVVMSLLILPVGVARQIKINSGFTTKIV